MTEREPYKILFLCTGNSARSILAEALMNRVGEGRFEAYSAGSHPKGEVHPAALKLLGSLGYDISGFRSKSWDEFEQGPAFDFIVTVCDNAAGEVCPIWPGKPVRSHWGVADPAAVEGSDTVVALAFADTYRLLGNRIRIFASLPDAKLDGLSVKSEMDAIGKTQATTPDDEQVAPVDITGPEMDLMMAWLRDSGLPLSDLADGEPRYFALHDSAGKAVAFGGLVGSDDDLMIRSVVTDPKERGQGAGTRLIQALSALAAKEGAKALWLLTTGGGAVFEAAGFETKPRDAAPAWIAQSAQFRSLCGPTAELMCKTLR